jgi:biotin carboxyl carrier protein
VKFSFDHNSETIPIDLTSSGKFHRVTIGDKSFDIEILHTENGKLDLLINGKHMTAYVSFENTKRWVTINGQTFVLIKPSAGARSRGHGHHHAAGELTAPMPGQVRAVNVSEGDTVTKGQTLLVLEAMKMEIRVQAPFGGMVSSIAVKLGQTVEREQVLIKVESQTSTV